MQDDRSKALTITSEMGLCNNLISRCQLLFWKMTRDKIYDEWKKCVKFYEPFYESQCVRFIFRNYSFQIIVHTKIHKTRQVIQSVIKWHQRSHVTNPVWSWKHFTFLSGSSYMVQQRNLRMIHKYLIYLVKIFSDGNEIWNLLLQ